MKEEHEVNNLTRNIKLGLFLNTGFTVFEFIVGIFSGSLALISDAGHNLTDSLSLLIAYLANRIAKRDSNEDHSYGYGRATILAALLNGGILLLLALYIFYEAYGRLANPQPVQGGLVATVAFVGILINGGIALLFRKNQGDLNIKAAYLNMFFDTLASVGALFAGFLIIITGLSIFDSIISILIGILLVRSSWYVVKSAIHVLLEGVPEGISAEKVKEVILSGRKVKNVDDLHIWAVSSRYAALSCHIVIEDCELEESMEIVSSIKKELADKFQIKHATIETELVECPPGQENST